MFIRDYLARVRSRRFGAMLGWLALVVLPFAIADVFWELAALLLPGKIPVDYWRNLISSLYLIAALCIWFWSFRSGFGPIAGKVVGFIGFLLCLWLAFGFQVRSNCGDEAQFIGQPASREQDSCTSGAA